LGFKNATSGLKMPLRASKCHFGLQKCHFGPQLHHFGRWEGKHSSTLGKLPLMAKGEEEG